MQIGNWNEKYSVNNAIIDDQHKRLLDILYRMERLVSKGGDPEAMVQMLTEMSDYALEHFKSEERYMQSIGYPQLERHREEHSRYTLEVLKFTLSHLDEFPGNPRSVLDFLTHWWTDHILKVDMDYANHVNKNLKV